MPFYFIVCLEVFRLDVRMLWKPFPTQGSHNKVATLLSQLYWCNWIYFPAFLGTIHCTDYWRLAESLLFSIFFCWLLQCFHYSSFMPFPTIFGHVVPLPTHVACPVSSSSSIYIHCIWVSPWTHLSSLLWEPRVGKKTSHTFWTLSLKSPSIQWSKDRSRIGT